MIIDRDGNVLMDFYEDVQGVVVQDGPFLIGLYYEDDESKRRGVRVRKLKDQLADTDYKTLKYYDGVLSEEEYAPVKKQRQEWRNEINALQALIKVPTITKEEIKRAEAKALRNTGGCY